MAFRELMVFEIKEILRLWSRGTGQRAIACVCGVDRKTVRRYVEAAMALGLERGDEQRALDPEFLGQLVGAVRPGRKSEVGAARKHCRTHRELIKGWVDEGVPGPKIQRLLERHTGRVVPRRTLQRFIADELCPPARGSTVWLSDTKPGQVLQIDFMQLGWVNDAKTGKKRKMYALLCLAAFSRHAFVWPCWSQTRSDVIEGLEAAWAFFGGVFHVLLPDNMSSVVTKADPIAPLLNGEFLEYAQSRGFVIDPARPRKPKDKAKVERLVTYVRGDFFGGERFDGLLTARAAAEQWSHDEAGMRVHNRTKWKPLEKFEQDERDKLLAAPTVAYDQPVWTDAKLGQDHVVTVSGALYSVPHHLSDVQLRVRVDKSLVQLFHAGVLVKVHPRQPAGGTSIDAADLPPGTAELAKQNGESLCAKAADYGVNVGMYARRLLDNPRPWTRMRHLYRLLSLCKRYGGALVDEACGRALEFDVVEVIRIERMLDANWVGDRKLPSPETTRANSRCAKAPSRFARHPDEWRPSSYARGGSR